MKRTVLLLSVLLIAVFSTSCGSESRYYDNEYFLMDSYMTVRLATEGLDEDDLAEISAKAMKCVKDIENAISVTVEDSDVSIFNASSDGIDGAGEDFINVLSVAVRVAELTDGAYDPTIAPLVDLWNISGGGPVPADDKIKGLLPNIGYGKLSLDGNHITKSAPEVTVDFGGIGKGYAVQRAIGLLSESEVEYGLCSFGSTVGVFGTKPDGEKFRVTVCDPDDTAQSIGEFKIDSGYISSSGDYERFFESDGVRYHHILDPETGYPVQNELRGVSVYSSNGQVSDALSTALYVMGVEKGLEFYASEQLDFEAVFITDDEIYLTDGLKSGDVFEVTSENYEIIN